MRVARRTVLKGAGAVGGGLFVSRFVPKWLTSGGEVSQELAEMTQVTDEWVPTTCWIGKQECGLLARRVNGRLVKLEGHPAHPRNQGKLCPKGMAQIQAIYDPNRVKTPLKRVNEKDVTGEWTQISWEEALALVGEKIKEARAKDPNLLVWQKGRSKAGSFYDKAFVHASGATKLHHGGFCSDAGYRACEYTTGLHGVLHPDFRQTRYLLSFGWNPTNGGGNKFCQITWHQQMLEARERGLKVVHLDPSRRVAGPFADEWLPVKPGTDMAFFLAVANVLVEEGFVDKDYLKKFTNAPFLVKDDGHFLTETRTVEVEGEEGELEQVEVEIGQVWDGATGGPKDYNAERVDAALEGTYTVDGTKLRTAFQAFKEHVEEYTPDWAEGVCGLPAATIRRVALEMGEAASIGSTIVVDGVELPYRPVGIMAYHVAQQELGFQAVRAALLVSQLLGTIEAVGGQRSDFTWKVNENWDAFADLKINDPPYNIYLKNSKFFPINSNNSSLVARVALDPAKYGVDYQPEVLIIHMSNPVIAFPDQEVIRESYKKYKFIAVIDPWLSETADYFADVVLPAATIEKYEGPLGVTDQYTDATTLRLPPMDPLFDSKGDIDIYIDLCEAADILFGEGGYIDEINQQLKLKDQYKLDLNAKPQVRDIFDRWAKSEGIEEGITFFEQNGVKVKGPVPVEKYYGYAQDPPFDGNRHRFYGESLLKAQTVMRDKGAGEIFTRQYTPFPTWMPATLEDSPAEYDLYLISRKRIEFKQSRSTFVPLLNELAPEQGLEINTKTAKDRGIDDGDEVWVESHNAVTGETRRRKVKVRCLETIRPDTVCLPHHYGFWKNPITKDQGPSANELFYSGEGYVSNTADQSFHVKVKIEKA